jgi:replication-associated recombination protein RarA
MEQGYIVFIGTTTENPYISLTRAIISRCRVFEFKKLSDYEINIICLLVIYHDIIGDILENGRSEKELLDLEIDNNELNMLIALSLADISAINNFWSFMITGKLKDLAARIRSEIS